MKAAVLVAPNDIRYEDIPLPKCGSDDVLIRVAAVGICGSDVPRVLKGRVHRFPIVLGHEFSGVIEYVGKDVTSVRSGEHVVGVPILPCGTCEACQRSHFSLCRNYKFVGSRINGAFAEYVSLPARNVLRIDPSVPLELGVFFETSSVALHALRHSRYVGGRDVVVLGGGTVGILAMQWARILGAARVAVVGRGREHLNLASQLGADVVFSSLDEDYIEHALNFTEGRGFDYVFEAAGATETIRMAFSLGANKSTLCFIGTPTSDLTFDSQTWELMNRREFWLTGSWMSYSAPFPGEEWSLTNYYLTTGALRFDEQMVHAYFPLKEVARAFEQFRWPGTVKGRIVLLPHERKE